jgi:hypothetical protein
MVERSKGKGTKEEWEGRAGREGDISHIFLSGPWQLSIICYNSYWEIYSYIVDLILLVLLELYIHFIRCNELCLVNSAHCHI